ncbi:hypothetical protein B5D77_23760 [Microcystis sp. MC19]|nr:hypothetical protein B5D77_23760 [Microcystis sp. MC19]
MVARSTLRHLWQSGGLSRVCGKKFLVGTGCGPPTPPTSGGVGFDRFSSAQLPNFQGKSP